MRVTVETVGTCEYGMPIVRVSRGETVWELPARDTAHDVGMVVMSLLMGDEPAHLHYEDRAKRVA